jgi:regulator of nonsense transcripts 3
VAGKEITPLLEFIRDKKLEKARFREERKDARKRRDDERRKAREEERKRKKDNAEKNFLEMMNEKTREKYEDEMEDDNDYESNRQGGGGVSGKYREDKGRNSESGRSGADRDRNRGERYKDGKLLKITIFLFISRFGFRRCF